MYTKPKVTFTYIVPSNVNLNLQEGIKSDLTDNQNSNQKTDFSSNLKSMQQVTFDSNVKPYVPYPRDNDGIHILGGNVNNYGVRQVRLSEPHRYT